ncbi:MAG: EAL domain-containing response regulator [Alphaproteobacteria bacterium]|nr:EAL domain-containing response regulator [Alphaproteobacteria bacterium]
MEHHAGTPPSAPAVPPSSPAERIVRLLVVDDETVQRLLVTRAAASLGHTADSAATLEEAEALVQSHPYDVIVLDLSLRDHDGIELLRSIARARLDPVLIFVSGFDQRVREAAARLASALGLRVAGTLGKPLPVGELLALLRRIPAPRPKPPILHPAAIDPAVLAAAIPGLEITCRYQPKVSLVDRRILGVEALVRWQSPLYGAVPPSIFIPLAERHGLIDALTQRVLATALAPLPAWRALSPGLTMAVNLSPLSLTDLSLPERVCAALQAAGVPPEALVLEVTEGAVMEDYVLAADILTRLRIRGLKLAIDDFGTGHSSLLSLLRLPFAELKIDQAFIRPLETDPEAGKVVRAVLSLGRELDLDIVAEGIETEGVANQLHDLGCGTGQGYLFDRPLDEASLTARLQAPGIQAPGIVVPA